VGDAAQELSYVAARPVGVGHEDATAELERGPNLTVDLGDERLASRRAHAFQLREPLDAGCVLGHGWPDRDPHNRRHPV
jgi:hypothetical protein